MNTKKKIYRGEPDYAVSPGALLSRVLRQRKITQIELTEKLEIDPEVLCLLLRGETLLTDEIAFGLERVLAIPASFWQKAESTYWIRKRKCEEKLNDQNTLILDKKPIRELIKRNLISRNDSPEITVQNVLKFFRQSSTEDLCKYWQTPICSLRHSSSIKGDNVALATWLQIGINEAESIDCAPYDVEKFKKALVAIRASTVEEARSFVPKMRELCAQSGVALVFVPELPNAAVNGAAHWISPEKAAILVNLRGKKLDIFWFTFFHEAAHILRGKKHGNYVDLNTPDLNDPEERVADQFAGKFLIPTHYNAKLPLLKSKVAVKEFAKHIGVHPGIVVGRLQHDKILRFSQMNDLKANADWGDFISNSFRS